MPEVLDGAVNPGIPFETALAICADAFGYKPDNARFRNRVLRAFNRALLDIWNEWPTIRRFTVVDAEALIQAGVHTYDVTEDPENGGFGWESCEEVLELKFAGANRLRNVEKIDLETYRFRQQNYPESGPTQGFVIIDGRRIKLFPTPDQSYTAAGDYIQSVPYITTGRVNWPKGWDQVATLGCEYYLARELRPDIAATYKDDWREALLNLRRTDTSKGQRPMRAVSTRRLDRVRMMPHDNSTDLGY